MMDLAMMAVAREPSSNQDICQLPPIRNRLIVIMQWEIGTPAPERREQTEIKIEDDSVTLVGR